MNSSTSPSALVSWSGGKDSFLAYWRARRQGVPVKRLVTALDEAGGKSRSHGIPPGLLHAQAEALGLELEFYHTTWQNYEPRFIEVLRRARADGIESAVFGDIDLVPHREWEEKVCAQAGLQPLLPLWGEPRAGLVDEFLALGGKAIVVCVDGRFLTREFCGREFDRAFLADLPPGVDHCGENGEFHTFVYGGPAFSAPLAFRRGEVLPYRAPAEFGGTEYFFQTLVAAQVGDSV
jgi:uncharacterized protein (TIGR00290 family)